MRALLRLLLFVCRHRAHFASAERLDALRVGFLLRELERAKRERGYDYCLSSSWPSDSSITVAWVRRPDLPAPAAVPIVRPTLREALEAAVRVVEGR